MFEYPNVIKNQATNTPKKPYFSSLKVKNKEKKNFEHLKWGEYILFLIILLFGNLDLLTDYLKQILIHGGTVFTSTYFFAYVIIGLPLTALNLFLGYFSRCGFFRLWSLSPIYKGVGYTIFILGLLSIIWSGVISTLSFSFSLNMLREEIPWNDCMKMHDFYEEYELVNHSMKCFSSYNLHGIVNNDTCCPYLNQQLCPSHTIEYPSFELSSLHYYRYMITNTGNILSVKQRFIKAFDNLKLGLLMNLGITWTLTLIMSTLGLDKVKAIIRKLGITALMTLVICFIVTIFWGVVPPKKKVVDESIISIFDGRSLALLRLVVSIFGRSLPLNVVYLGARAPSDTTITMDALFITIAYLIMMFIFTFWTTTIIRMVRSVAQIKSVHCITRHGAEVLLSLIPDLINTTFPFAVFFAIIYYLSIYILGLMAQVLFVSGVLDSIEDIKPAFHEYRLQFSMFLCATSFLCGIILITPMQYVIVETWFFFGRLLVIIIAMTLYATAVMWTYGANRLQNDINFLYKTKLGMTFWIICWKCFPFMGVTILIYLLFNINWFYDLITDQFYMRQTCTIVCVFLLLPIPCSGFYYYFRNIRLVEMNNTSALFKNNEQWGPLDNEIRRARNRFKPKFEKRYKNEKQKCQHTCMANSKLWAHEMERLEARRKLFLEEIQKMKSDQSIIESEITLNK